MESARFDVLSRRIGEASRRGLLRRTLGFFAPTALMAILGTPDAADAAKNGRCKPACGICQRCQKGKCRKKNGKKRCKKGKCQPAQAGTPCDAAGDAEGTCCGPDTGGLFLGCCAAIQACCPDASGGGCCASLDTCCSDNSDCNTPLELCFAGCCILN